MRSTDTTTTDLAARYGLHIIAAEVHENPHMADMPDGSTHWEITLEQVDDPTHYMTFMYSQGPAITDEPDLYSVLSCLTSDAGMWESGDLETFEDYCSALGEDSDSRSAEREYVCCRDAVRRQTSDLRYVMQDQYDALLADDDVR